MVEHFRVCFTWGYVYSRTNIQMLPTPLEFVNYSNSVGMTFGSPSMVSLSLVDQTTPSSVLDVLHHQHAEGGSGHSGTVFVTDVGI